MYGTPVLGANIGGIPELIRVGETGELFESGNIRELKKQLCSLWDDRHRYSSRHIDNVFDTLPQYADKLVKMFQ